MSPKDLQEIRAEDIMNPKVFGVSDELSVEELAKIFQERKISGAPVIDVEGRIVGVVTASDIASMGTSTSTSGSRKTPGYYATSSSEDKSGSFFEIDVDVGDASTLVKEIMTDTIFSVHPDAPVREVASTMVNGRIHRVFVMDSDEKMLGVISALDMVKLLASA